MFFMFINIDGNHLTFVIRFKTHKVPFNSISNFSSSPPVQQHMLQCLLSSQMTSEAMEHYFSRRRCGIFSTNGKIEN